MTPLEQIAEARKTAKDMIEVAECLDKLQKNRAFNKLINEYVLKELPLQAASMFNRPGLNEVGQAGLENTLTMVSTLNQTFSTIYQKAEQAQQTLAEIDEAEQEYLAETGQE